MYVIIITIKIIIITIIEFIYSQILKLLIISEKKISCNKEI